MTPALDRLRIFAHSFFVIWCPAAAEEGGEGGPEQVDVVECGGRAGAQDEAGQPQGSRETNSVVACFLLILIEVRMLDRSFEISFFLRVYNNVISHLRTPRT